MLMNYFKTAWRYLKKDKVFTLINITGLTLGITICMMIFLFIMNEFSVDSFHKNGKDIYRVMRTYDRTKVPAPWLSVPYATALKTDFPDAIKSTVRILPSNDLFRYQDISFNEKKVYVADADFFSFFSFPLIAGNPATALQGTSGAVLTEATAKKYFGTADNAIGKVLEMDKRYQLTVTGVARDVPSNSHLNFDIVVPISIYSNEPWFQNWSYNNSFTYVQLNRDVNASQIEKQLPAFMQKYMGQNMERSGAHFSLSLLPLRHVYFQNGGAFDPVKHGDKAVVYVFLSIAVLILLIACINFMNLSTIRAVERSKEVGLRKVLGAVRSGLVKQFLGESLLLTLISCLLSLCLLRLLMPYYNALLGYSLMVSLNTWPIYLFLLAVIGVVGFASGSYPAFFLSSFAPIESLRGKLRFGKGGAAFRQVLVVAQFSISVLLIVGTIVIMNQMSYVKHKQLGYQQEQTVVIPINNEDIAKHALLFKNELQNEPPVASVSLMSGEPGGFFDQFPFEVEGRRDTWSSRTEFADFEFVKTLGLHIIAGRDLSPQFATDSTNAVLINRTAATELGFTPDEAIGKWIKNNARDTATKRIVGVVEDFHFLSLKQNMEPLVIAPSADRRVALVRLKSNNAAMGLAAIKKAYAVAAPVYPFEYTFLDQKFDDLYKTDLRQQTIISIFAVLAIFIACLGLFGLASFTASKRVKEIGVRKVLGSSVNGIVVLLSKDLLKPVLIAACIALPLGYFAMQQWLQHFAYRTSLHWWIFALAALTTFLIAFITISARAIQAALANPVKSLKTE